MEMPKMILFDYGDTLLLEPDYNSLRGTMALMRYMIKNPLNLSALEINQHSKKLWENICQPLRDQGFEFHNFCFQKLLYESLGIEFSLSSIQLEQIFWNAATCGVKTEGIEELLEYLWNKEIRTGVISNISFSSQSLKERINRLLPNNHFEFIITSSDYMVRKPNHLLFEVALKKAGLLASDVWFCGDLIEVDCKGANQVGIYSVLYRNIIKNDIDSESINFDCLVIDDWQQLITVLNTMHFGNKDDYL